MNLYSACSLVSALNVFMHFALQLKKKNSKNLKSPGETFVPVVGLLKKYRHDFSCNVNAHAFSIQHRLCTSGSFGLKTPTKCVRNTWVSVSS